jgi:branched-chain amino acid transport system substrate-binding protein
MKKRSTTRKGSTRKFSRRTFLKYGAAAGLGGLTLGKLSFSRGAAKKPILIGITSDASGTFADSGAAERRGMYMAVEEFNAKGGVLGRKIEYKHEDTETDPSAAARKAKRLIDRERVDFLIGALSSGCAVAISQVAQREGIVYFNTNSSSDSVTNEHCHRTNFCWDANNHMFSFALGPWVHKNLGTKWFYLTHDYTWGKSGTENFRRIQGEVGAKEVGEILIPLGTRDFSAQIIKIMAAKPDVVMMTVAGIDLSALSEQVHEFGADKTMHWCYILRDLPDLWAVGAEKNFGVFGITWHYNLDCPGVREFTARYKKRWPKAPIPVPGNVCYNGYIGMRELLRAVERADTTRSHDVIKALEGWTFTDSLKHHPSTVREWDHICQQTMYVARAKPKEKMKDVADFYDIIGTIPPDEPVIKRERSKCKMESYADTPVWHRK